jgi:hypothetical protein
MLKTLLFSAVFAEDLNLLPALESDLPRFVAGDLSSMKIAQTIGLQFSTYMGMLPKYPLAGSKGMHGGIAIGTDGFGFELSIGPQILDILLTQIPEEGLPDKVDTIDFQVFVKQDFTVGPKLNLALDFKGEDDLQVCFSDTIANVAGAMATMEFRRLDAVSDEVVDLEGDIPGMSPSIAVEGTTEIITFHKPPGEPPFFLSDGSSAYEGTEVLVAVTPPDDSGLNRNYASLNFTMTGPDPTFKFMTDFMITQIDQPLTYLPLAPPDFCKKMMTVSDLMPMEDEAEEVIDDMDLNEVGDPVARRTKGVEEPSKKIAVALLKKLHAHRYSAQAMLKAYHQEKDRLVRRAYIGYSVAAVLALALLFTAGTLFRHSLRVRKFDAIAVNDVEAAENTQ